MARVFAGFAVATVVGLPLGTLVGRTFGWHATFLVVVLLAGAGLIGVLVWCPPIPNPDAVGARAGLRQVLRPGVARGLAVTLLTLTGFVTVFTYVTPMLQAIPGFGPVWVSVALVGYGVGTVAGNLLAGRVRADRVAQVLPLPVAGLALVLLLQGPLMQWRLPAVVGLVLVGLTAFAVVPLVQTWLMGTVGSQSAALTASVNVSVAGVAGALGAGLGGAVLGRGPAAGLDQPGRRRAGARRGPGRDGPSPSPSVGPGRTPAGVRDVLTRRVGAVARCFEAPCVVVSQATVGRMVVRPPLAGMLPLGFPRRR